MNVKQIANMLNTEILPEITGESVLVEEDLSNIVDIGKEVLGATDVDNYVRKLIDRVGRMIFVDRTYRTDAPNITREAWEWGSILEKVRCEVPDFVENDTWQLQAGQSYDPFVFNPPSVKAVFYNRTTAFECDISICERQVKESFINAGEYMRFIAMIENRIRMKISLSKEGLIMRTIVNLIGEKIASGNNVINLLTMYNGEKGTTLTATAAMTDKEFLRYAAGKIMFYSNAITRASMLYNNGGYITFTPKDYQRLVLLSEFDTNMTTQLLSDTYHDNLLRIGSYDVVPYWQGSGTSDLLPFTTTSAINVKTVSGTVVNTDGVIGVMFDRDACAICNDRPRVTTIYNPKGEYTNYFYKEDCSYMNDTMENCIVFVVKDPA